MHSRFLVTITATALFASVLMGGCSRKDAPTFTPVYHVGTPTNRSSVNSWEQYTDPTHTQPGMWHGKAAKLRTVPSIRGFEPYDPLAARVFTALSNDTGLTTRYITTTAKGGVVELLGTVPTAVQRAKAASDAAKVTGVAKVLNQLVVQPTSS